MGVTRAENDEAQQPAQAERTAEARGTANRVADPLKPLFASRVLDVPGEPLLDQIQKPGHQLTKTDPAEPPIDANPKPFELCCVLHQPFQPREARLPALQPAHAPLPSRDSISDEVRFGLSMCPECH